MELPATSLSLPRALPFPITIQRIHAPVGSTVRKTRRLLTYSFIPAKPDEDGNRDRQVREWESPVEGEVVSWAIKEGDVVRDARCVSFCSGFAEEEIETRTTSLSTRMSVSLPS